MEITTKELQEKIQNGEKIILKLGAEWCHPCNILNPIFEKVSNGNQTDVQLFTMDVDKNSEFVKSLGVRNVPTIKLFNNGEVVDTKVGIQTEEQIKSLISNLSSN
jgi:thioredoxin 1